MNEISTYSGPYARLREVIGSERSYQYEHDAGAYSKGFIAALDAVETVIVELERSMVEEAKVESAEEDPLVEKEVERCR